jgi:23S rRNA (cytidine2498-2'-O)-methyltransferase
MDTEGGTAGEGLVFQAIPGFEDHLEHELAAVLPEDSAGEPRWIRRGPLYQVPSFPVREGPELPAASDPAKYIFWRHNIWLEPRIIRFSSISEAAKALRSLQRNWAPLCFTHFRRAALITEKLPPVSSKRRPFPWPLPDAPMGAWTLLDKNTLLASPSCSSPFPGGKIEFQEDREGPPSRAYLKLWEALTLARSWPGTGSRCLDAGASPGGWTWALARLGAEVTAVDRAPLDERIAAMPGVRFIKHDAFTLKPEDIGPIDWLFCDAACYPPRLYRWIEQWLASGLCKNFVCTIKMQGVIDDDTTLNGEALGGKNLSERTSPDFETPKRFAAIPGGRVVHLWHNKHELTWMCVS